MTGAEPQLRIIGAGGHAAVAADAWEEAGGVVLSFHGLADSPAAPRGPVEPVPLALASAERLHIAIGNNVNRRRLGETLDDSRCPVVRHPTAIVSRSAAIGAGTLVCAGTILQPRCRIGRHVIVNTGAIVEHDCRVGDFVHLAPGARLAGDVEVGDGAFVGIGAVVIQGVRIGADAVIGAGAVVLRDVEPGTTVVGVPARPHG